MSSVLQLLFYLNYKTFNFKIHDEILQTVVKLCINVNLSPLSLKIFRFVSVFLLLRGNLISVKLKNQMLHNLNCKCSKPTLINDYTKV